MKDFILGFKYAIDGASQINKPKVKRFVFIPLLINTLLFGFGLWLCFIGFQEAVKLIPTWLPNELSGIWAWLNAPYQWFRGLFSWLETLLWLFFVGIYFIVVFYGFTILANIISSPFNGYFSAAIERNLLGEETPNHVSRSFKEEIKITLINETKKMLYSLFRLIPLLILSAVLFFIPVFNALIPVLWFIYGARMMSIIYIEPPLTNHGYVFSHEKKLIKQNRLLTLGFGCAIMLMTMIPVLNFFALPVGVSGATVLFHKHLREDNQIKEVQS